jgi:hypothetical protein
MSPDRAAETVGAVLLDGRHLEAPHPDAMPEPAAGAVFGGPGCCLACLAPTGCHASWCAMRGASARDLARLRATGGGS